MELFLLCQGFFFERFASYANLGHFLMVVSFCFFLCNANVTVLMVRVKYGRFLQVVAEHVTIIWPVLF